jgi:hypothetical protein
MEETKSPARKKTKTVAASSDKENAVAVSSGKAWVSYMNNQGEHFYVTRNDDISGLLDPVEARKMALKDFYENHVRSDGAASKKAPAIPRPSPVASSSDIVVAKADTPEKEFGEWTPQSIFSTPPKCKKCNQCPCIVDSELDEAYDICDDLRSNGYEFEKHNEARKTLYRFFAMALFGHTGKGNRKKLPSCVVGWVRMNFPDENDTYMGHKDANKDNKKKEE